MAKRQRPENPPAFHARTEPETGAPSPGVITMQDLGIVDGVQRSERPRLNPSPAFVFMFHPELWFVLEGQVVPALKRQRLQNAVNGITQREDGKFDLSRMREIQAKKGWVMLDPMIDGKEAYLYAPVEGVYLTRWETAHAGSRHITPNPKAYAAWLRKLIAAGKLPAPQPYVLESLLATLRSDAARLQDQVRSVPSVQVDLDAKLKAIAAVERELAGAKLTPVPKASNDPLADLITTTDPDPGPEGTEENPS